MVQILFCPWGSCQCWKWERVSINRSIRKSYARLLINLDWINKELCLSERRKCSVKSKYVYQRGRSQTEETSCQVLWNISVCGWRCRSSSESVAFLHIKSTRPGRTWQQQEVAAVIPLKWSRCFIRRRETAAIFYLVPFAHRLAHIWRK